MKIYIKSYHMPLCRAPTVGPRILEIEIDANVTIAELKNTIAKIIGGRILGQERQRLLKIPKTRGRFVQLENIETLYAYEIEEGDTLLLKVISHEQTQKIHENERPEWRVHCANDKSLSRNHYYYQSQPPTMIP